MSRTSQSISGGSATTNTSGSVMIPDNGGPNIDGGIAKYKDYEIVIEDERNFILKHK